MIQQWWSITRTTLSLLALGVVAVGARSVGRPARRDRGGCGAEIYGCQCFIRGDKMFVPSVLVAEQGDTVQIKVVNKIPGEPPNHGFAIPAFDVEEVVNSGETKTVEFVADKAGLFDVKCQLHPAHLSAQLIVQAGGK